MSVYNVSEQPKLNICLAQVNFIVGDIEANCEHIIKLSQQAYQENAELIAFPELTLTGYPPEDLILRDDTHLRIQNGLALIAQECPQIAIVVGYPEKTAEGMFNTAAVLYQGDIIANYRKSCLPNYSVFDEKRYFTPSDTPCVFEFKHTKIGLAICEDLWHAPPAARTKEAGAELIISINASPYEQDKAQTRECILQQRIREQHIPILYVHWSVGQDELVFDGGSMALDSDGIVREHAGFYSEKLLYVSLNRDNHDNLLIQQGKLPPMPCDEKIIYDALRLGVRDYITKNHFSGALIGLSGGIDSALSLTIAVDAIGPERVEAVMMPSRFTSQMSLEDAQTIAGNLNVKYTVIPIEPMFEAFLTGLDDRFIGLAKDTTEENLQARIRGTLLMAISNKTNKIVLTTGNKSEMAVGYSTLYGDMAGGFCVLRDVLKTMVYTLGHYRNTLEEVIPRRIIERPASAELAHDQTDQDSLPAYEILDKIIIAYVEQDLSIADIVALGIDEKTVRDMVKLITRNEYKRRQAPPGVRISQRAFGRDRRYPITSSFNRME